MKPRQPATSSLTPILTTLLGAALITAAALFTASLARAAGF